jgi:hypothetical protein
MQTLEPTHFILPPRPKIKLFENTVETPRQVRRQGKEMAPARVSEAPPHTQFSVIPSRAIIDPRINSRKPLILLLGAIGIHASAKGLCYPSQRRLGLLCGRSPSWAGKYIRELVQLGYLRRLAPPTYRGPRSAWRLQVLWRGDEPTPEKEIAWEKAPWCWG